MTTLLTPRTSIALAALVGVVGLNAPQAQSVFTTRGAFVALSVSDLDASTKWYLEKLGLTVVMRPPKQDESSVAVLEGNGLIVELLHGTTPFRFVRRLPASRPATRYTASSRRA